MSIMQGTTPSIKVKISPDDFSVSDVSEIEFYVRNDTLTTYHMADLTIDAVENSVTKEFTEEETIALDPKKNVIVQARFFFADGKVIGIEKLTYSVSDMEGVGV